MRIGTASISGIKDAANATRPAAVLSSVGSLTRSLPRLGGLLLLIGP